MCIRDRLWEAALRDIQEGRKDPDSFISEIADTVRKMTEQRKKTAREYIPARPQGEEPQGTQCPGCKGNRMLPRVGRNKKNKFWACSDCGLILSNERGKTPEDGIMPPLRPPVRAHKGKTQMCIRDSF